jgi:hypothetical protein
MKYKWNDLIASSLDLPVVPADSLFIYPSKPTSKSQQ